MRKSLIVLQKVKHGITVWPSNVSRHMTPQNEGTCSHKNSHINTHEIIHDSQKWKSLKCQSNDEWINNNSISTLEYFYFTKRNDVLIHATTWRNTESKPDEISQLQNPTHSLIPYIWTFRIGKPTDRSGAWLPGAGDGGVGWGSEMGLTAKGYWSISEWWNYSVTDCGNGCITVNMLTTTEL